MPDNSSNLNNNDNSDSGNGNDRKLHFYKDKTLSATAIVIVIIIVLLVSAYFNINQRIKEQALQRMEEGIQTVTKEVASKLERDSHILNAAANVISEANNFDVNATLTVMQTVSPLLETMTIRVLMPDNEILIPNGQIVKAINNDDISFDVESKLGEHISNRGNSLTQDVPILRHFVPIIQDGQVAAMLYGVTDLSSLPESLSIESLYNSSANVYIIDTQTGDFILDTKHEELKNVSDYSEEVQPRRTKGKRSWNECIQNMLNLDTGYIVYRTDDSKGWQYLYYSPMGINRWSIAVDVSEKEAFASVFAIQRVWVFLGVFLGITIICYYFWVRRNAKLATEQAVEQAVLAEKLEKVEAANQAKSAFLSNMSHDIRTPMNAIIGFATLAQGSLDNPERLQDYLKKILSSSNHLLSLINDVLDMSRIESGKLNIEEKECSISDIFRDMRNIIQTQMHSKQLNFFMDTLDIVDENIYCDKLHINQVLLNLLSNAIKFTPAGGTVALTIQQKPRAPKGYGSYEIRVKDTGVGMSEEFLQHIFEPFERERSATASGIEGTGLGMAIAKNIIDTMGGTIEVQSEQGKGTEFIINLDFRLQADQQQIEVVQELQGMHALVVDDNFTTCDSITKMLRQIGMRSEWVLHGKEAVLHARQAYELGDEYHVYIIDWYLPDLSGLEVVRQIRAIVGDSAPIIVVTAYDWTAFEEEAREAGVTAFCNKPIFLSELRDILIHATGKEVPEQDAPQMPDLSEQLKGTRLLLAEDIELNREIAVTMLSNSGFLVETAKDGSEAVEMVKNSMPGYYALVLMDIQMPNMNGYEATRAIRSLEDPKLSQIPIIAMTANAFDEDRKQALDSGMNAHISKPIDIGNLLKVISEVLGH